MLHVFLPSTCRFSTLSALVWNVCFRGLGFFFFYFACLMLVFLFFRICVGFLCFGHTLCELLVGVKRQYDSCRHFWVWPNVQFILWKRNSWNRVNKAGWDLPGIPGKDLCGLSSFLMLDVESLLYQKQYLFVLEKATVSSRKNQDSSSLEVISSAL